LGGGEARGAGLLERDQAARELEQREVVLLLLGPADEDRAVAVEPRVGGLDDPPPRPPAGGARLEVDLLAARADVRRVAVSDDELADRVGVVGAVEAQPLGRLGRGLGPLDRDRLKGRR
jgi:hypothetical protein